MPGRLTRQTVTAGSRIILPAYPGLVICLGLLYILQSPERTSGPSFDAAKEVLSIPQWGIVFLALGAFKVAAFFAKNSTWLKYALVCGAGLSGFWAGLLLWSAWANPEVSYTSGLWVVFVMLAHIASINSLTKDIIFPGDPTKGYPHDRGQAHP